MPAWDGRGKRQVWNPLLVNCVNDVQVLDVSNKERAENEQDDELMCGGGVGPKRL